MESIIKVKRKTKLTERNVNGILYEQHSLQVAIDRFIKNPHKTYNVIDLYNGVYVADSLPKDVTIDTDSAIGRCISIGEDYVEIELIDPEKFHNRFKNPVAMFRMRGSCINKVNNIFMVMEITTIDIMEHIEL